MHPPCGALISKGSSTDPYLTLSHDDLPPEVDRARERADFYQREYGNGFVQ